MRRGGVAANPRSRHLRSPLTRWSERPFVEYSPGSGDEQPGKALAWIAKEAVQLQRVQNEAARAEKAATNPDQKTLPAPPESVEEAVRRLHLH